MNNVILYYDRENSLYKFKELNGENISNTVVGNEDVVAVYDEEWLTAIYFIHVKCVTPSEEKETICPIMAIKGIGNDLSVHLMLLNEIFIKIEDFQITEHSFTYKNAFNTIKKKCNGRVEYVWLYCPKCGKKPVIKNNTYVYIHKMPDMTYDNLKTLPKMPPY